MSISCNKGADASVTLRKFAPAINGESTNSVNETSLNSTSSRRSRTTGSAVANFQPPGNLIDVATRTESLFMPRGYRSKRFHLTRASRALIVVPG